MPKVPSLITLGRTIDTIDVRLSYKIVELFSEGLYASPNKAIEELVANAFDAGASYVNVTLSANLHDQDASIVVIDDGHGMNKAGLQRHWLIGTSNKRNLDSLPKNRQQIGKFGIGKLATYVLSSRLSHVSKSGGSYFAASMDFTAIDKQGNKQVQPKQPISIPLRELTEAEAKQAVLPWTHATAFAATHKPLFGRGAPRNWTLTAMTSLKPKVFQIRQPQLEWILRTALPLRPDFEIWLNGKQLTPSKQGKGLIKTWMLGRDLVELPKPAPKPITVSVDRSVPKAHENHFGLDIPGLGRVTGYAEAYRDLLTTGKSESLGRSHGFFVYVFGRLVNVGDGHFGISPDELRHGTFGRFRAVVHMNGLDEGLRSNREAISEGPLLEAARDVLRGIFNAVRPTIDKHDADEAPGESLARKVAATPASLSRTPIVELARAVVRGSVRSRYLNLPETGGAAAVNELEMRAAAREKFVTGVALDYSASTDAGIASYDVATGVIHINAWHPFVATFYDDYSNKTAGQPLELLALAEVLNEAHLHTLRLTAAQIDEFLSARDQLLRYLANESGRKSAFAVALNLHNARNSPDGLEAALCAAFDSLGFDVTPIGGNGKPDGVATAILSGDARGHARRYSVSLEAKSKERDAGKVAAGTVKISAVRRQRDAYKCTHAVVVGRDFPAKQTSALAEEIDDDRAKSKKAGDPKTISLVTIDDLARLVRLRPLRQVGLAKLREMFDTCRLPEEARAWIDRIEKLKVTKPAYRQIIQCIHDLQDEFATATVEYGDLRVALARLTPLIRYNTNEELYDLCSAMSQMAPNAIYTTKRAVELDQSVDNVVAALEAAPKEYPIDEQA